MTMVNEYGNDCDLILDLCDFFLNVISVTSSPQLGQIGDDGDATRLTVTPAI